MTKTQWLLALLIVVALVHALVPRYEWRPIGTEGTSYVRIDRWFGDAQIGMLYSKDHQHVSGRWRALTDLGATAQ